LILAGRARQRLYDAAARLAQTSSRRACQFGAWLTRESFARLRDAAHRQGRAPAAREADDRWIVDGSVASIADAVRYRQISSPD
jgi:hypothetical protein